MAWFRWRFCYWAAPEQWNYRLVPYEDDPIEEKACIKDWVENKVDETCCRIEYEIVETVPLEVLEGEIYRLNLEISECQERLKIVLRQLLQGKIDKGST